EGGHGHDGHPVGRSPGHRRCGRRRMDGCLCPPHRESIDHPDLRALTGVLKSKRLQEAAVAIGHPPASDWDRRGWRHLNWPPVRAGTRRLTDVARITIVRGTAIDCGSEG